MEINKEIFELIFPKDVFEWFTLIKGKGDEKNTSIIFEEKDIPPLEDKHKNKKIIARKFYNITITDFPLRGKRTLLTFRRRYWKVEGQKEYLKRDIKLSFPGTQLEKEFANFLKEDGGRKSGLSKFYREVSADPSQRI
jgi:hypothetical protein